MCPSDLQNDARKYTQIEVAKDATSEPDLNLLMILLTSKTHRSNQMHMFTRQDRIVDVRVLDDKGHMYACIMYVYIPGVLTILCWFDLVA